MEVKTKLVTVQFPGRELQLEVVEDIESLITDPYDEDKVPSWADIWPAAYGLARFIYGCLDFDGESLLELGAGIGLPGMAAALKGASVTLSDFNPMAIDFCRRNARRNGLDNVDVLLGDWRSFVCDRKFDWIIGSDVLYDPKLNRHVGRILDEYLEERGKAMFAHPGRQKTYEFLGEWYKAERFIEQRVIVPVTVEDHIFPRQDIVIHLYRPRSYPEAQRTNHIPGGRSVRSRSRSPHGS